MHAQVPIEPKEARLLGQWRKDADDDGLGLPAREALGGGAREGLGEEAWAEAEAQAEAERKEALLAGLYKPEETKEGEEEEEEEEKQETEMDRATLAVTRHTPHA